MDDQFVEYDFMAAEEAETGVIAILILSAPCRRGRRCAIYVSPRENVSSTGTYVYY
jgi:hypothetical protein